MTELKAYLEKPQSPAGHPVVTIKWGSDTIRLKLFLTGTAQFSIEHDLESHPTNLSPTALYRILLGKLRA